MTRKKSQLCPRRKRMNRQNRLQHARDTSWLESYSGKNIIKGYRKWFGVDPICAVNELRMLGAKISQEKETEIRKAVEDRARARRHQKEAAAQKKLDDLYVDSDETFAFIAGYTSGDAPYGTKWEELEDTLYENMFTSRSNRLFNGRAIKLSIENDSAPVSFREVIHRWQNDSDFRAFFIGLLLDSPFSAFRWETPPVTSATSDRPFEFVILDSPEIALDPDPSPFAEHCKNRGPGEVVAFSNLGRDAVLIAPCPDEPLADYGHLASYLRNAQESQQHLLWESVGAAMQRRISAKPVWLSTAGGGVAWLHVRLDDQPKYYQYAPYLNAP